MKKLIFIMLLGVISISLKAQQQVIHYFGYTCYWNTKTEIPDSVIYTAKPHKKIVGREANFHPTGGRLNENKDYHGSGYDQGHLCNASDENGSKIDEYNSFDQCNIYPQLPNLNRRTWLQLETEIRTLATKYKEVKVKVYWHGVKGYMGVDKVVIPLYCDKEIEYNGKHEKYSMPNQDSVTNHPYTYYLVKK
jgi:DNA/RNA endonuclease G (NUC1)